MTLNPKDPLRDLQWVSAPYEKTTSTVTPKRAPITTTTSRVQRYPDLNFQICGNTPSQNIGIVHHS